VKGIILDLYSGMGGASEAFVRDGWEVIRMENNPMLADIPHTRIIDVLDWKNWLDDFLIEIDEEYGRPIDIVWASPPCREFSTAYAAPWPTARREGRDYTPDLSLMEAAYDIICRIRPQYWIIENVSGAVNWFKPELGNYRQRIGPFCLWGRLLPNPRRLGFRLGGCGPHGF
jgi:site-specific DNA-cytosine methylase